MTSQRPILIIDDDHSIRWVLSEALQEEKLIVETADSAESARKLLANKEFSVIITDIRMPGEDGFSLLQSIKRQYPNLPVIVMTAHSDLESAVNAYDLGAFDYLAKPFDIDQAVTLIYQAMNANQSQSQQQQSANQADEIPLIIGEAPSMQEVFRAIGRLSRSNISVLINGESGTGKELVARALHQHSQRNSKPFIALNMAAIPKDLVESELFGHEKGAFTGAKQRYLGRFEQANDGTLFLDEIGDMPLETQTRLLRVLSEGSFYRLGGTQPIRTNVRVITATHQNLSEKVAKGEFREDLFHRINVIKVELPKLSERASDIPLLAEYFLGQASTELDCPVKTLTEGAAEALQLYSWPGNVRQLENVCRWLTVMTAGNSIDSYDLPPEITEANTLITPLQNQQSWQNTLKQSLAQQYSDGAENALITAQEEFEQLLIDTALALTNGRKQEAAKLLGWGRNTITRKQKKHL
ncbi:MAG: nitrogen regulation protein NR(I) [Kangiellaceae bacterium]|jgi:two-component system nitrogen regulation response regulator GlnG|nr:nitrogen regulation protein NR(I) [Kangiellaceae bacterium]